jgi:hypothetical protein
MNYPRIGDNLSNEVAVLVVSCDNYADLWPNFFLLYRQFWKNNSLPTYLLTNFLQPEIENVNILAIGEDVSWSDNLLNSLGKIPQQYILLFLEDLFLTSPVDDKKVQELLQWSVDNSVNYLRFNPTTKPDIPLNNTLGIVSKGAVYRTSVVVSLWKKDILHQVLKSGENAWEFEHHGAERSDVFDGFYSTYHTTFPVINTVIKRVWERSAMRKLRRLGLKIDPEKRPVMSVLREIFWKFRLLRSIVFSFVPGSWRRMVKRFFQGSNYKY